MSCNKSLALVKEYHRTTRKVIRNARRNKSSKELSKKVTIQIYKNEDVMILSMDRMYENRNFSGGPVTGTLGSQCREAGFDP